MCISPEMAGKKSTNKVFGLFVMVVALSVVQFYAVSGTATLNNFAKNCNSSTKDAGEPLFLTKYIESGSIEKARVLSKTGCMPNAPDLLSYSGFITVNKTFNSNIFFWFFPAVNKDKNAPVLLWLQGGPGVSGLFGFFVENGPFVIDANMTASIRKFHWAKTFQMIFVDNPVGSGFSFTDSPKGYVTNQEEMAENMYEFLKQFFTLFHEYRNNDFYITGESYAGKYIPSLAYKIHSMGSKSAVNLTGVAIGNGMCDPETMMDYGTFLYNIGLVDEMQADEIRNLSASIVKHIQEDDFYDAIIEMDKLIINFSILPYKSLFTIFTGMDFYYNFLMTEAPKEFTYYHDYIQKPQFRKALHIGNAPFQNGKAVQKHLLLDVMKSVKSKVAVIMDHYRVMIYNGQLDMIVPYPSTINFLKSVNWTHAAEYKRAKRHIWRLKGSKEIAGYVHNVGNFYEVLVRNVGHILPYDNPEVAFDLITRFINKEPFW